ncbi:MAG: D-alanine--D-alanine ligase [Leptospiraceae bacterium]|nr:D-alanine--D-alanine ligase [Leptospiraceae bacterium]MDW7976527.1 D-alanine--D-alanine ligase family protein [Leptospiraceae bacterium]
MKTKVVGLIFGGPSTEHEISILSAKNIYEVLKEDYTVYPIYIDRKRNFFLLENFEHFPTNLKELESIHRRELYLSFKKPNFFYWDSLQNLKTIEIDILFPITHGTLGEDGSLQGLMKFLDIPFVGCDVLSSALCMDKEAMKQILKSNHIPVVPFKSYTIYERENISLDAIINELGLPVFVKPARQGSSVGVRKASSVEEIQNAISYAFRFDTKILIEKAIHGREIECSVLGNFHVRVSIPGEVRPNHEFYSYEAKYLDPQGADLFIPAENLTKQEIQRIQEIALSTYKALYCEGFARVDMFYADGEIYVNEVNTLPGFTNISMYPKLWEYEGMSQKELLKTLIELTEEKANLQRNLITTYKV